MDNNNYVLRKAERQDVPLLLEFIRGIASYEKMENEVVASAAIYRLDAAALERLSANNAMNSTSANSVCFS